MTPNQPCNQPKAVASVCRSAWGVGYNIRISNHETGLDLDCPECRPPDSMADSPTVSHARRVDGARVKRQAHPTGPHRRPRSNDPDSVTAAKIETTGPGRTRCRTTPWLITLTCVLITHELDCTPRLASVSCMRNSTAALSTSCTCRQPCRAKFMTSSTAPSGTFDSNWTKQTRSVRGR